MSIFQGIQKSGYSRSPMGSRLHSDNPNILYVWCGPIHSDHLTTEAVALRFWCVLQLLAETVGWSPFFSPTHTCIFFTKSRCLIIFAVVHVKRLGILIDYFSMTSVIQLIKVSGKLGHQPTAWPVPYACAQPYHPGGHLFRPCQALSA